MKWLKMIDSSPKELVDYKDSSQMLKNYKESNCELEMQIMLSWDLGCIDSAIFESSNPGPLSLN